MKRKHFLRGLGLGVFITALILGISYRDKMSDESVIARAKKLGMVFADAETSKEPTETEEPENTNVPEASKMPKMTAVPVMTKEPSSNEKIEFSISRGSWSRKVSEELAKLKLVDNSDKFDEFLVTNGYAEKIKVGDFKIRAGSSYDEIANMITE